LLFMEFDEQGVARDGLETVMLRAHRLELP
jgi:hypothetical protein